jgi:hypothetical protein
MNETRFNTFALCFSLLTIVTIACKGEPTEESVIRKAAIRNGCFGDDYLILLAIRKAENGRPGREFGIMNTKANNLDRQAGWCAATIMAHHKRQPTLTGKAFIDSLADRYCPAACDPIGNVNWKKNVWFWFKKHKEKTE